MQNSTVEKISDASVLVAAFGFKDDIEVVDLESTSTVEAVLVALKSAFTASSKRDASIQTAAANDITITSMWRLKNGQQVSKLSVSREAKPMDVTRVRVGWTSCRLRIHRPEATRCPKCHGFSHSQRVFSGPDLKESCRRCGSKEHKEKDCIESSKCVACDRVGLKSGPHRPGTAACKVRCAAKSWRSNNLRND